MHVMVRSTLTLCSVYSALRKLVDIYMHTYVYDLQCLASGYHLPSDHEDKHVVDYVLFDQPLLYFPYAFTEEVFKSASTFCVPYEEAQRVWDYLQFQGYYILHYWSHFAMCQWRTPDSALHTR